MTTLRVLTAAVLALWSARSVFADTVQECVAASSDAQDLRHDNKLIESRTRLLTCAREACPAVIKRDCVGWLAEIDASMPTIVVSVRDASGADVVRAHVMVDGSGFLDDVDGKARAINPGVHKIRVEVSTGAPLEQELVIREGEKNRLVELRLPAPTQPSAPTVTPPATDSISTGHTPTTRENPPVGSSSVPKPPKPPAPQRIPSGHKAEAPAPVVARGGSKLAAYVVGGGAIPLLVGALGFEFWGRSLYDDAKKERADQANRDSLYESANLRRYVGEGFAVAGVGCLAVAVWLYVRAGRDDADHAERSARLAPIAGGDRAGLAFIGTF